MFEVQTPALRLSIDTMSGSIKGIQAGTADLKEAAQLAKNCSVINMAVATELKVRLAKPKLDRFELELQANKQATAIEKQDDGNQNMTQSA
jgi:hypothetical protein